MTAPLWDPEPPEVNSDTAPWWEATRKRRLLLQRCGSCGHLQHYPRTVCLGCGGTDLDWTEASGRGTVYSFSEVMRSPDPDHFATPYTVALVRLEEGPLMFTRLTGSETWRCDQEVELAWHPLSDGRRLPTFRLPAP